MAIRREMYSGFAAKVLINNDALYDCDDEDFVDYVEFNISSCCYDSIDGDYLGKSKRHSEDVSVEDLLALWNNMEDREQLNKVLQKGLEDGILEILSPACIRVWNVYE